jgi:serine protease Do
MTRLTKSLAVLLLGGGSVAGFFAGSTVFQDARFARAADEVKATREQLAHVEGLSSVFREVGKVVEPSVVKIDVRKSSGGPNRQLPFDEEMLRRFFPDNDGDGQPDVPDDFGGGEFGMRGTGSGVIMEVQGETGYVVTNNHVAGNAAEMTITLADGRQIENGKVVGTDAKTDLAVVKIEAERLIAARWGDSDELQKGDWIMAFGSPFGYVGSMTHGIVSALNRTNIGILGQHGYENFIQVDAPINPGNSGGPLVNVKGEVVGVNTAIASRTGAFQGVGFAIPSNQAKFIYAALKEKGKVTRGWLGVSIMDVSRVPAAAVRQAFNYEGTSGVLVQELMNGAPVKGKLERGDIITHLNGKSVGNVQDLRNSIAATPPGSELKLQVSRRGERKDVSIKLGEQPENLEEMAGGRSRPFRSAPGSGDEDATAELRGMRLATPNEELVKKFGLTEELRKGAVVTEVKRGSPAAKAGLQVGDVVTEVANKPVSSAREAAEVIAKQPAGEILLLYVTNAAGSKFVFVEPAK